MVTEKTCRHNLFQIFFLSVGHLLTMISNDDPKVIRANTKISIIKAYHPYKRDRLHLMERDIYSKLVDIGLIRMCVEK